jgi:hypothetical protein
VACVDGTSSEIWAWGQFDIRYYSNAVLTLYGVTVEASGLVARELTHTTVPYQTYIFVASIKTPVLRRANYARYFEFTACLSALENGTLVERCSPYVS